MSGTSERWQRLEELCQAALERSSSERAPFLLGACGDDADLRRELETLLARADASWHFLEMPVGGVAAHVMREPPRDAADLRFAEGELISDRFLIRRQVGEGGMAVVYEAIDTKLNQRCALKCAKLGFSRRLSPEARSALRITHENICRIYGIYTVETPRGPVDVLAMEYVDGETVWERLARTGPIGVAEAVEIARQMCQGLSMAHRAGVLHRDLKSNNVMLTRSVDGSLRVVITDFGIATQENDDVDGRASGPSDPAGAMAYMAPELLDRRHASVASDIYALGIVLQEMMSGRLQTGDMRPEASSFGKSSAAIEPTLAHIVDRCLEKNPDGRFRSADALRLALESVSEAKRPVRSHHAPANSIAVLPFVNMSSDPENDFFCDGFSEELINALTRMPGLQVAARTSAFRFRGRDLDIREIGRQLNVATVLEGSVRRAGGHLRITAQLINVADGYHLWSDGYDCELAGVFEIQDGMTASILRTLEPTLLAQQVPLARRHSLDIHAFELYLKGQQLWHQRTPQSLRAAVLSFAEAIRIDHRYALAHAGLAASYAIMAAYGFAPLAEAKLASQNAATQAMTLDPRLPESHFGIALSTFVFVPQWHHAEAHFRRAVEIEPRAAASRVHFGFFLATRHRFEEALGHLTEAIRLDPLSPFVHGLASLSMYIARRYDEAIQLGERALELQPELTLASWSVALALARLGQHERALERLERTVFLSGRAPVFVGLLGFGHAVAGHRAEALALLDELHARSAREYVLGLAPLAIEVGLGDRGRIFAALHEYLDQGYNGTSVEDTLGPYLDAFASEVRFAGLFDRLGLVRRRLPDAGS